MGTHPIFESDFDCLTEMKLILPLLAGPAPAQEIFNFDIKDNLLDEIEKRSVSVDQGGDLTSDNCKNANSWTLLKLGDKAAQQKLAVTTETESSELFTLKDNKLTVNANSKDRSMMGMVVCSDGEKALDIFQITGEPKFASLANSLTNLDGDANKRIDCQVSGYPLPVISWKFQAIDKEEAEAQCANGACSPCLGDDDLCNSQESLKNSSNIFDVPLISSAVQVRYSVSEKDTCPMNTAEINDDFEKCKIANDQGSLDLLSLNEKQKSQLFFSEIKYAQRGKYICQASQEFKLGSKQAAEDTKSFIWRVKDPTAALWPFLALVAEVMIVVCIILYYEKASSAKKNADDEEEAGEFIAAKKDEN